MSDETRKYRHVVVGKSKIKRILDDGNERVSRADVARVCEEIVKKPDGFSFFGTTIDYALIARSLRIDAQALQGMYLRGRDPNSDPDDRYAFQQLDAACARVETQMVLEWRAGSSGARSLLEAYIRKYSKSFREHMEVELMNYMHTLRLVADDETFLRFIDALRVQDPTSRALVAYKAIHAGEFPEDDDALDIEFEPTE